jgi:hypothetical protein
MNKTYLNKWRLKSVSECDCGYEQQTVIHIVEKYPNLFLYDEIEEQHRVTINSFLVQWLKPLNMKI